MDSAQLCTMPWYQLMLPVWRGCRSEPEIKYSWFYTFLKVSACVWGWVYGKKSVLGTTWTSMLWQRGFTYLLTGLVHLIVTHQAGTSCEMGEGQALPCTYSFCPLQSVTQWDKVSDIIWALDGVVYKTDFIPWAKWPSKRKASSLYQHLDIFCNSHLYKKTL